VIYVIAARGTAAVKIGHTIDPTERLGQLQTGNAAELQLLWTCRGDRRLEGHLHAVFHRYRVRGEWFDLSPLGDAVRTVQDAVRTATGMLLPAPQRQRVARRPADAPATGEYMSRFEERFCATVPAARVQFLGWDDRFPPTRGG
jgi:hypothetical protein